jgi:hypothetical protein
MNSAQRVKGWPGSLSKKCTHTVEAGLSRQASGSAGGVALTAARKRLSTPLFCEA